MQIVACNFKQLLNGILHHFTATFWYNKSENNNIMLFQRRQPLIFQRFERHAELARNELSLVHWNSEHLYPLEKSKVKYYIWRMWTTTSGALGWSKIPAEAYKMTDELKAALQTICEELPQEHINKTVANFTKRLTA